MASRPLTKLPMVPSPVASTRPADRANVSIYRPFFLAGLGTVLTAGCTLGAIALLGIALNGSYTASAWTPYVWAHANSQVFGWVGFFVMGFALQNHAPSNARADAFHRLAYTTLALMGSGIALRFVAEALARTAPQPWVQVGVFACTLQFIAVVLFLSNTTRNRYRSGARMEWQTAFVFSSLFWLLLIALAEPFVFAATHGPDSAANTAFIARWFGPLREAQFLGFASMMIFGVALVKFHSCIGFRKQDSRWGLAGFGLWWAGLVARIVGWLAFEGQGYAPQAATLYRISSLLLFAGALAVIVALRVFEPAEKPDRSQKFLRSGFGWLAVAGALLVLEPLHLQATGTAFSHAYTGAIRHAVTVGFISQMIVGVALHVVGKLNAVRDTSPLWSVFVLLNLGNTGRVALEIATDYTPAAFRWMGATGFIELAGLALWAFHLARPMLAKAWRPARYVC